MACARKRRFIMIEGAKISFQYGTVLDTKRLVKSFKKKKLIAKIFKNLI